MTIELVICLLFGIGLGLIFFIGLWWTVRRAISAKQPAVWFLFSLIVRMTIVLSGFYWIMDGHWQRLVAVLLGFIIARIVVTRITPMIEQKSEQHHAS